MSELFNCVLQLKVGSKERDRFFELAVKLPVRPNVGDTVEWMPGRRREVQQVILVNNATTLIAVCKGDFQGYRHAHLHEPICCKLLENGWTEIKQAPDAKE